MQLLTVLYAYAFSFYIISSNYCDLCSHFHFVHHQFHLKWHRTLASECLNAYLRRGKIIFASRVHFSANTNSLNVMSNHYIRNRNDAL